MPTETSRLKIKKPLGTETVSRQSFNDNWDLIDQNAATRQEPEILAEDIFATGFAASGMTAAKNGTTATQLDVASGVAYVKQAAGGLRRYTPTATNFTTSVASTTYYLDFQPDGTYSWGTAHSTQANYLPIAEVVTDSAGNIVTVTDKRNTVPGAGKVNAAKLQGKQPSDFISSADNSVLTKHLSNKPVYSFPNLLNPNKQAFTRASDAYRKNGEKVPYGVLRTEQGKFGQGAFIEESTTNLLLNSESFDNWSVQGTPVITSNSTTAPNGTTTADTVEDDDTAAFEGINQSVSITADTSWYTLSIFIKKDTVTTRFPCLSIAFFDSAGANIGDSNVRIDTTTGQTYVASGTPYNVSVYEINGYYRLSYSLQNPGTGVTVKVYFWPAHSTTLTGELDAATTGSCVIWGAQLENKPYLTSYMATNSTFATRNADQLSYILDKPLPKQHFGALVWKPEQSSATQVNVDGIRVLYSEADLATNTNRIWVQYMQSTGVLRFAKLPSGGTQKNLEIPITFNKGDFIFVAWLDDPTAGYMYLWCGINGGALQKATLADTQIVSDAQKVGIGYQIATGGNVCNGTIDFPIITDTIPTDEQVEALYRASEWGGNRHYPYLPYFPKSIINHSLSVDLPSIAANSTATVDVALPAGMADTDDWIVLAGSGAGYEHGILIQILHQGPPRPKDTARLRVTNFTGGAIDPAPQWMHFMIIKKR